MKTTSCTTCNATSDELTVKMNGGECNTCYYTSRFVGEKRFPSTTGRIDCPLHEGETVTFRIGDKVSQTCNFGDEWGDDLYYTVYGVVREIGKGHAAGFKTTSATLARVEWSSEEAVKRLGASSLVAPRRLAPVSK